MRFTPGATMASRLYSIYGAFSLFSSVAFAASLTGSRLLVVLEDTEQKASYSQFFGDLEGLFICDAGDAIELSALTFLCSFPVARGYELKFESPKTEGLSLFNHGEREYDNLILFPPKSKGMKIHSYPLTFVAIF